MGGARKPGGSPRFDLNTSNSTLLDRMLEDGFSDFPPSDSCVWMGPVLATSETRSSSCCSTVWQTQGFFLARVRKKHFPTSWNVNVSFVGISHIINFGHKCMSISSYYPISILESQIEHAPKLVFLFVLSIFLHAQLHQTVILPFKSVNKCRKLMNWGDLELPLVTYLVFMMGFP